MTKTPKRISLLFRELADAFDQLGEAPVRKSAKRNRQAVNDASREAVTTVRENLRRGGIKVQ